MAKKTRLYAPAAAVLMWGCGARSWLPGAPVDRVQDAGADVATDGNGIQDGHGVIEDGHSVTPDAHADTGIDSAAPPDASAGDPCPSALQAGAPRAMFLNCSTRDGRARVAGPTAPKVTWQGGSGSPNGGMAADNAGGIYFRVDTSITRMNGVTGTTDWVATLPNMEEEAYDEPLLLANDTGEFLWWVYGVISGIASPPTDSLDTFSLTTGATHTINFASDIYPDSPLELAVGTDGSLYIGGALYVGPGDGGSTLPAAVSRLGPDGSTRWTSVDLWQFVPPGTDRSLATLAPGIITLGGGDLVLAPISFVPSQDSPREGFLIALDPSTGQVLWTVLPPTSTYVGGVAVATDQTIDVLYLPGAVPGTAQFAFLRPSDGHAMQQQEVSVANIVGGELFGVTVDGTMLAGLQTVAGMTGYDTLTAVSQQGEVWTVTVKELRSVTIDSRGTLIAITSTAIEGLDFTNGNVLWTLPSPSSSASIVDATLTSAGGIVAELSDYTAFGASD